jgi:hypothetical protein
VAAPTGTTAEPDDFETAQLDALQGIRDELKKPKLKPAARAILTKAMNDTIKAIRMHRTVKPPQESEKEASAERVIAKLRRLASRAKSAEPASDDTDQEEASTGT